MAGVLRRNWRRIVLGIFVLIAALSAVGYFLFRRAQATPGIYANEPGAALLPNGTLAVMYQTMSGVFDDNVLGVATIGLDDHLEQRSLRTEKKRHFDAWMTVDPSGTLHAAWLGHDGGRPDQHGEIRYATSRDGLDWTVGAKVHDVATDCPNDMPGCLDKPMIVWTNGAALVLYFSEAAGLMKAVRVASGKVAGPSVPVGEGAYGDVTATESGVVHVAYATWNEEGVERYGDRRIHVQVTRSDDGGKSFGKDILVSAAGESVPFYFSNVQVAFDQARDVLYVVYPTGSRDGRWAIQLAASRDGGRTWSRTRVNDDAPCSNGLAANHMTPRAVLDPKTGRLHVIWLENRSGTGAVVYASCDVGGASCSPNENVSDAPFASYTFGRHRPDWLGEYPALVIDVERRVLHAVWAQPVDDQQGPVSRLFHARAQLTP
jgi:hypothetical protein